MKDALADKSSPNQWGELLNETRLSLATLRAEDLTELAARAECMLSATIGDDSIRQRLPWPHGQELLELSRECRLLSNLLAATTRNLEVLRRIPGRGLDCTRAGEANSRWVR